ncbi:MAG: site-2 protease family protein [Bacteroidetes bacterium]|nr:site-2 protease family protein [Bacteroidota bacterium]MCW5897328.1 site-2 protease family protein [Bacteroidota bacterium]
MDQDFGETQSEFSQWKRYAVHIILFGLTFFTTTLAGVDWLAKDSLELTNFSSGLTYSVLILIMLSAHEFGHYFAARYHKVEATLPFYIPFPPFLLLNPFGTMGAVIRLRSAIPSRKVLFDIGVAGPLAGFVATAIILAVGFQTLPSKEYLYSIHPEYALLTTIPDGGLHFGNTLFLSLFREVFAPPGVFIPPMNEIYHYPFLCVGWFGMLVTAMNLIPVGQLDGGHISYSMFGTRYHTIAQAFLVILVVLGLSGMLREIGIDFEYGWFGWFIWAMILIFMIRRGKMHRPPIEDDTPLDPTRRSLGWLCAVIFVGCISLVPISYIL